MPNLKGWISSNAVAGRLHAVPVSDALPPASVRYRNYDWGHSAPVFHRHGMACPILRWVLLILLPQEYGQLPLASGCQGMPAPSPQFDGNYLAGMSLLTMVGPLSLVEPQSLEGGTPARRRQPRT